jgi:death-on-curing protein
MPKIFEIVDPIKYKNFVTDLNKIAGEIGLIINNNELLSVLAAADYYTDSKDKISCIVRGLIKNHAFSNGNKRTACLAFLLLAKAGNFPLKFTKESLKDTILDIATHNYTVEEISKMLF